MDFINRNRIILFLAFLKFILPYVLQHPMYEMHRDEFLYLEQGNHLAWGFMEVPPLLSIFAWLTHLFGSSFFWVKFWPSLFGAINVFIVGRMAMEMGGKSFAQIIACMGLVTGAYLRVHYLFQPNFLEIFFWSLSAYYLIRYINTKATKYIYLIALSLALSTLSKYSVLFFIAGIFIGLLFTSHRKLFLNKHLYIAASLALILILPNIIWQYMHKWPVITHMKELRETQLQFISPFDFLKNQVLMHIACFFVWIGGLVWLFVSKAGRPYRIIGIIYIVVVFLLTVTNGKDYYTLGVYPMLFAAGGVWLEQVTRTSGSAKTKRFYWLRYASVAIILILFIPIIPASLPVWKPAELAAYYKKTGFDKSGILKWEDLKEHELPQDFADMISWKELGDKVSGVYASLPEDQKKSTLVYCRNYALAGAVTYHGKNLPQVTTDNASFLFWMPEKYNVKHLLFVGRYLPESDDIAFQQFEKFTILDSVTTPMARERGVKIVLFENGNEKLNPMIEAGIKELKDEFRR
jgi:hypothetical protein